MSYSSQRKSFKDNKEIVSKPIKRNEFEEKKENSISENKSLRSENIKKNTSKSKNQNISGNDKLNFKLRRIFEYYCQFGDKMNVVALKSMKYYKMMQDCRIMDENLNKTRVELIFSSENKHKPQMSFETFLNSLIKIAEVKYENLTPNQALQKLLKEGFLPLYDKIFENNFLISQGSQGFGDSMTSDVKYQLNSEINFENDVIELLTLSSAAIFEIYRVYFPFELSLAENETFILENSQKYYFIFLKDFDLCPTLVSKSVAFQIFQTEIANNLEITDCYMTIIQNIDFVQIKKFSTKNFLGQYFNFFKFLRSIARIADVSFDKLETNITKKLNLFEKICLTLERMEMSEGFQTIEQKTAKTHNKKSCIIVPKEISDRVKFNIFEKDNNENESQQRESNQRELQSSKSANKLRKSIYGLQEKINFEYNTYIMEKYGNEIFNIFKFYCSFGDPLNTTYMTNTKWTKFLREAGLIKINKVENSKQFNIVVENSSYSISLNDVDRIFFKVTNNTEKPRESVVINSSTIVLKGQDMKSKIINSNSKIDFNTFLSMLEYISLHILPNLPPQDAIDQIIKKHVLPLGQNISQRDPSQHINFLIEKQNKPELVEILMVIHKAFLPIYKFYSNKYTFLMNFDAFLLFCKDFSIFPDIVPKSKLNLFFKSIATCMNISQNSAPDNIDDNYFVDLLALCAFEIPYRDPEPSTIEKLLFFIEKLSQSEGTHRIIRQSGSTRLTNGDSLEFINIFRKCYPDYFEVKVYEKPKFFDLLSEDEEERS